MKRFLVPLLLVALFLIGAAAAVHQVLVQPPPPVDTALVNDIANRYQAAWPGPPALSPGSPPHTVVALDGRVVAGSDPAQITNDLEAVRRSAYAVRLVVDDRHVGMLYVAGERDQLQDHLRTVAAAASALILAVVLLLVGYGWHLYRRLVAPFERMQTFAAAVAAGRLDAPLRMDRTHALGPLTESFDLLRDQLAASRAAEAAARSSKVALVDDLNHDLRSLVATISATTELLQLHETDPARARKLEVVLGKARQIEALTADLVRAGRDELTALEVCVEATSTHLVGQVVAESAAAVAERSDSHSSSSSSGGGSGSGLALLELPECLVALDLTRWTQICDNLFSNAVKHAGTPVEVTGRIRDGFLEVVFRDHGPGVPEDELDLIGRRGYRCRISGGIPGEGLGLTTSLHLAHAMGGSLQCFSPTGGGLGVRVLLPLAR